MLFIINKVQGYYSLLKNIVELHIIYCELRDQVIAPPTPFFILAPSKTFLGLKLGPDSPLNRISSLNHVHIIFLLLF